MHGDQARPFERLEDAMREGPNFAPTGVVPVSAFPIKSTIKVALACTVFDFAVDNV